MIHMVVLIFKEIVYLSLITLEFNLRNFREQSFGICVFIIQNPRSCLSPLLCINTRRPTGPTSARPKSDEVGRSARQQAARSERSWWGGR